MPFDFYDYDEIKSTADCRIIARDIGLTVKEDRCAATWRGGTNPKSVSLSERGWHDFGTEESGSVIDLVAKVMFNGLLPYAQQWLGQHLSLTPTHQARTTPQQSRYQALLDEGYTETARYRYTDAAGQLVHQVARLEHPEKKKEFVQGDAQGRWSVKGKDIQLVLYNLPAIAASDWAVIVEGEKDADTLIAWGIPATTNAGGSRKWEDSYSDALAGKDVVLCPDKDSVGSLHADMVGKSLVGKARSIRLLSISATQKDVTDWRDNESGTREKFLAAVKAAPTWIEPREDEMALREAKEANATPLRNFKPLRVQQGNRVKVEKEPRTLRPLIQDVHRRFLGFPRVIGSTLFDHDRDTGDIVEIHSPSVLFAWMQQRSNNTIEWTRGDSYVTKEELFYGLRPAATKYEAISNVPDWPRRSDVYYAHPPLPAPTDGHDAFNRLLDFFSPANPEYRVLLGAMFCAPLYFKPGIPRPMWIIDSEDGAGTGKTTIAEMLAQLYGNPPIQAQKQDLYRGMDDLVKRLVSSGGRRARVFLLDNVTGAFRSEELAGLVTRSTITGKAPYGRGEESRPNNLTYVITANSASVDNDLAVRSFFVFVRRSDVSATWKSALLDYVTQHRLAIFADMLDILSRGETNIKPQTRFPEFETAILRPLCIDADEYSRVVALMRERQAEANTEEELGKQIEETIIEGLQRMEVDQPEDSSVFIHSAIAEEWLEEIMPRGITRSAIVQTVRNLAKNGLCRSVDPSVRRYPHHGKDRRSGILWKPNPERKAIMAIAGHPKRPKKITLMEVM